MKKIIKILIIFDSYNRCNLFCKMVYTDRLFQNKGNNYNGRKCTLKRSIKDKLEDLKGKNIVYIDTKKIEKVIKEDAKG